MFVERRTRMDRMAAMPVSFDPASAARKLSLVPPAPAPGASPSSEEPQSFRPRFRRLVVFTGRIS